MKYGVKPIGTHAHEWFMFHAAEYGFKMANELALEHWVDVYRGDLGVALSDTYTTDVFFQQFDKKFAKLLMVFVMTAVMLLNLLIKPLPIIRRTASIHI
jgi:nicotinic acid phosphoribosyltransferase